MSECRSDMILEAVACVRYLSMIQLGWRLHECRCCRKTLSKTGKQWSIGYQGAWSCWHRYISIPSLYLTRSGMSSQWSSLCMRWVRPWSKFRVSLTMRAATFNTHCSLPVAVFGTPAKIALQ